jgi:uncharacterized paraquat-inducible protein A
MTDVNPYQAPASDVRSTVELSEEEQARIDKLSSGQKLVIYAVLVYFLAVFAQAFIGPLVIVILIVSLIMSLIGVFRVLAAFNSHIVVRILLFLLLFVPLINMLVLLRINGRATRELREAGYEVGLMGVKNS